MPLPAFTTISVTSPSSNPGQFEVLHGLTTPPVKVDITMCPGPSVGGQIWETQPADNNVLYLGASDINLNATITIWSAVPVQGFITSIGNSTTRVQDCLDYCQTFADLNSSIPVAGYSVKKVIQVVNAVMKIFLSSKMKWLFNRRVLPIGITNSWQQDYATNLSDVAFLQSGYLLEINNTSNPRPIWEIEAVQNLPETTHQYGRPGQISTMYNRDLQYGYWGASGIGTGGIQNPQPNQTILSPVGVVVTPQNPRLQVRDQYGNLWVLTKFGTTGSVNPFTGVGPVVYPSYANPTVVPTTVIDGTPPNNVVWTAVNPMNFGFRMVPLPPATGVPYQIHPVYQRRPPNITTMNQFIDPIPDDYASAFMDGLVAHFYQSVTDPKIRAKHADAIQLWAKSLYESKESQDRTRDSAVFYPYMSIMGNGDLYYPNASCPYNYGY